MYLRPLNLARVSSKIVWVQNLYVMTHDLSLPRQIYIYITHLHLGSFGASGLWKRPSTIENQVLETNQFRLGCVHCGWISDCWRFFQNTECFKLYIDYRRLFYCIIFMFCFFKSICQSLVPRGIVDGCSHGSAYWWRIIGRPFGRPHNQLWDEDLFVDLLRSKEVLSSDHIHILFTIQKMQLFHSQVLSFHSLWIIVLVFCLP